MAQAGSTGHAGDFVRLLGPSGMEVDAAVTPGGIDEAGGGSVRLGPTTGPLVDARNVAAADRSALVRCRIARPDSDGQRVAGYAVHGRGAKGTGSV
jgi:hypothetical protein